MDTADSVEPAVAAKPPHMGPQYASQFVEESVVAGSLHWMEWGVVLPRFRDALCPGASLAIAWQTEAPRAWTAELDGLRRQYSAKAPDDQRPHNLMRELTKRGLFYERDRHATPPEPFTQSVASYVESLRSRDGLSSERMGPTAARAFDDAVTHLLRHHCADDTVRLKITGHVVWGYPAPPTPPA